MSIKHNDSITATYCVHNLWKSTKIWGFKWSIIWVIFKALQQYFTN